LVYLRGDYLVDGSYDSEREEPDDEPHQAAPDPKP
jgi:hypothetical protein